MVDLHHIKDTYNIKPLIGVISIFFCILIYYYKPFYVEGYMILFLIPAIGLIIHDDLIKNNHIPKIIGVITVILIIFMAYISINGYSNAYHTLTNLYLTNQINHIPTTSEINDCKTVYLEILGYTFYNILCGYFYLKPTKFDSSNYPVYEKDMDTFISVENVDTGKFDNEKHVLTVKLTDTNDECLPNKEIKLSNGMVGITDEEGLVKFNITFDKPGKNRLTVSYEGDAKNHLKSSQDVSVNFIQLENIPTNKDLPSEKDNLIKAYTGDEPYIFISYAHVDENQVQLEKKRFTKDGYNIWFDEEDIPSGDQWLNNIANALSGCSFLVVFITPNSIASKFVLKEILYADSEEKTIIPIYLEKTTLKSGIKLQLQDTQGICKFMMDENVYIDKYRRTFNNIINN